MMKRPQLLSRGGRRLFRGALAATLGTVGLLGYTTLTQTSVADENPQVKGPANVETIRITVDDEQDAAAAESEKGPKFWLGVMLKDLEGDLSTYLGEIDGVFVDNVFPDSPAAKAELAKGDILLKINGEPLASPAAVMKSMSKLAKPEGDESPTLNVLVLRNGKEIEVDVQLEARPAKVPGKIAIVMDKLEDAAESAEDAESMANAFSFSWTGENGEALKALIEKMGDGRFENEMKLFRMGDPAMFVLPAQGPLNFESMQVVIKQDVDGEEATITISRKDGQPATIKVESDGETTEYSEEEMEEMPAAIRDIVKPALQQTGNGIIRLDSQGLKLDTGSLQLKVDAEKAAAQARNLADKYRAVAEKQAEELKARVAEMAAKAKDQAKKAAIEAEAAMREAEAAIETKSQPELAELRQLVDQLRGEVKELRQQLKQKEE